MSQNLRVAFGSCCNELIDSILAGKQSMLKAHKGLIVESANSKVTESLDFDSTMRGQYPEASRWDYFLHLRTGKNHKIIGVEVHQLSVTDLVKKKQSSIDIFNQVCTQTPNIDEWILIVEGDTSRISLQIKKQLADKKIRLAGKHLTI